MNFLDWLENFSKEYNLIGVGLVLLLAAFLGSFLLKTASYNRKLWMDR